MNGLFKETEKRGLPAKPLTLQSLPELTEILSEENRCRQLFRLLRGNRNFRLLWSAQVVSELGDLVLHSRIYSLLLDLTASHSVALHWSAASSQTLITPTAGVVNDRKRRQTVMIAADLARLCYRA